jgi:predicted AAA+ superfamily ATPase
MRNDFYIKRYLENTALSSEFSRQMRFIAGPRQSGKTTLAKKKLQASSTEQLYYNWDRKEVRNRYRKELDFISTDILDMPENVDIWVCFDEIHKMPKWKNILKDFFDTHEKKVNFVITGSARLDMFRKSGDSLAGRYFLFRLNPLILSELIGTKLDNVKPENDAHLSIRKFISMKKYNQNILENMLQYSSFPEPLLKNNSLFSKKWHENYFERIIKEDLRDISSIHQLEKVIDLIYILPSKIGSPLSINSLRKDLELNFSTVKNYINYLIMSYILFEIAPYSKKISRLVKKEKKVYFYNYAIVNDEAARFENFIALELKARIDLWNDICKDKYSLSFIKTRDGRETDFLILKNSQPHFLCEVKLSDTDIARHHYSHSQYLDGIPFVQIVKQPHILKVERNKFYVVSASRFF